MTRWVLDASVVVKWILRERGENDTPRAEALLHAFVAREIEIVQPPHWLAEVAAVASRLAPERAGRAVALLHAMEIPFCDTAEAYAAAVDLSVRLSHHLFDTLYHGVAMSLPNATLVTADEAYLRKARRVGRIARLADVRV